MVETLSPSSLEVGLAGDAPPGLTPWQYKALKAAGTLGYDSPFLLEVARAMSITQSTAKFHLHRASRFLGSEDTFSAICRALHKGVLSSKKLANGHDLERLVGVLDASDKAFLGEACEGALEEGYFCYKALVPRWKNVSAVHRHVISIYSKLRRVAPVSNRAQLAVVAYHAYLSSLEAGLVDDDAPSQPSRRLEALRRAGTIRQGPYSLRERVGAEMSITPHTAKNHLYKVNSFFGSEDTFSAVCRALNEGVLSTEELANGHYLERLVCVLDASDKAFLGEACWSALKNGYFCCKDTAPRWGEDVSAVQKRVRVVYRKLRKVAPLTTRAQLAVVAYYAYCHPALSQK